MRWLKRLAVVTAALLTAGGIAFVVADEPRPKGQPGPKADALARLMQQAVNLDGWDQTGAVTWNFDGRNQHLWDRQRGLSEVRWDDVRVIRSTDGKAGRAYRDGQRVSGAQADELLAAAHKRFVNDSFWLNPFATLFDAGVRRERVSSGRPGVLALAVHYGDGGVTPGDSYVWFSNNNGVPLSWKMWVSIVPLGGLRVSWGRWTELRTGARVSTLHKKPLGRPEITNVGGAGTLAELVGPQDPFAPLFAPP